MTYCMYDFDLGKLCPSECKSLLGFGYAALLMLSPTNTIELVLITMLFKNVLNKISCFIVFNDVDNFVQFFFLSSI